MVDKVTTQKRSEEILAEWDQDAGYESAQYQPVQEEILSLDLSGVYSNVSITSPYTVTTGTNFPNAVYTTNGATTAPWLQHNPIGAKIQLDGESADITVNGWSLVDAVKRIEERLGLFQPNPDLENEWSDLRALADQYRKLEQHIRDKQATFDRIKAMPAPEVD